MATVGELYSFSEEFIENAVVRVVSQGSLTPISGAAVTVNFTGFGESSRVSTTDSNGFTDFFLVDVLTDSEISATISGNPLVYNFTHQQNNLELFTIELLVTNSEILQADLDNNCANQEYYLTWINSVGGYEFWKFTARASKGIRSIEKTVFDNDIFQNWDTEFINGLRDKKILQNRYEDNLTLRTQLLTEDQANALSNLPKSSAVFLIQGNQEIPVQVNPSSFEFFTDRQKTIELEFSITLPEKYGQTS